MARILSEESSLTRKRQAIGRESIVLRRLVVGESILAVGLLLFGAVAVALDRSSVFFWLGVMVAVMAGAHYLKVRENRRQESIIAAGVRGEILVSRLLAESLDQSHYLFNDLLLKTGRAVAQLDHVIVCPHGLFLVETKNWRGHIEGKVDDPQWTQTRNPGDAPLKVSNPVRQTDRHREVVAAVLRQAGLDWPDIQSLVVFTSPHTTWSVHPPDIPVFKPEDAVEFIARSSASRVYTEEEINTVLALFMEST